MRRTKADEWRDVVTPHHRQKNTIEAAVKRMTGKASGVLSTLKVRTPEGRAIASREEIEKKLRYSYGSSCFYCGEKITYKTMGIDHGTPIDVGGSSAIENLDIICKRCNTRKGNLLKYSYLLLLKLLKENFTSTEQRYILGKLGMKPIWRH